MSYYKAILQKIENAYRTGSCGITGLLIAKELYEKMVLTEKEVVCPCGCVEGKSFNSSTGSEKTCTVCKGTGKLTYSRSKELNLDYLFPTNTNSLAT